MVTDELVATLAREFAKVKENLRDDVREKERLFDECFKVAEKTETEKRSVIRRACEDYVRMEGQKKGRWMVALVASLPMRCYEPSESTLKSGIAPLCLVCNEEYREHDRLITLRCNHEMEEACLVRCIAMSPEKPCCPICGKLIIDPLKKNSDKAGNDEKHKQEEYEIWDANRTTFEELDVEME